MEALIALGILVFGVVTYCLWCVVSINRINGDDDE